MSPETSSRVLRRASVLALVALALMIWSIFDPRPPPVLIALSLGQVLGTLSFASLLFVIFDDLRVAKRLGLRSSHEASSDPKRDEPSSGP